MMHAQPQHIDIYTDGGYFPNRDIGGWACVIFHNQKEVQRLSGHKKKTSSLEMELYAAQQALTNLQSSSSASHQKLNPVRSATSITLHTDSRILIEGLQDKYASWCLNDWKVKSGKTVVYKELWQSLFVLVKKLR